MSLSKRLRNLFKRNYLFFGMLVINYIQFYLIHSSSQNPTNPVLGALVASYFGLITIPSWVFFIINMIMKYLKLDNDSIEDEYRRKKELIECIVYLDDKSNKNKLIRKSEFELSKFLLELNENINKF